MNYNTKQVIAQLNAAVNGTFGNINYFVWSVLTPEMMEMMVF